jgi:RNA polymerase sigma factor (sigma-70 family)
VPGHSSTAIDEMPGELIDLRDTAARVVRSRHSGGDGEDLVQEAWIRVASALASHEVADRHAYTAAVAANLVRGWDRRDRRRQRWAPRLWTRPTVDAPDGEVVAGEEAAAMGLALSRLPESARDVLVAHVVQGMDTATLAHQAGTSPGAVAACLARARAMLRVEYLIAFRRLPEPPDECRRVCYAISAHDSRRAARLDTPAHLASCATCRSLTDSVVERRRPAMLAALGLRLAGWQVRLSGADGSVSGARAGGLVGVGVVGALAVTQCFVPVWPGIGTTPKPPAAIVAAAPAQAPHITRAPQQPEQAQQAQQAPQAPQTQQPQQPHQLQNRQRLDAATRLPHPTQDQSWTQGPTLPTLPPITAPSVALHPELTVPLAASTMQPVEALLSGLQQALAGR